MNPGFFIFLYGLVLSQYMIFQNNNNQCFYSLELSMGNPPKNVNWAQKDDL